MEKLKSVFSRCKAFLAAHRAARIAAIILGVLLALLLVLHPYGSKTYLIMGIDNYGSLNDNGRSDVMMLVHLDFTRTKISAVTFARDMFVESETGSLTKINTIVRNQKDGEQALCEAVTRNFGIPIDGWFRVNFSSVISIVDALGGVNVELSEAEAHYIDKTAGTYPDSPMHEGLCHLNGAQALTYARCRKLDNDLGRGDRQSKLFEGLVKTTKHMTGAKVAAIVRSMRHAWQSSLSGGQQVLLVGKALWMRGAKVTRLAVPFTDHWRYGNAGGTSGVLADLPENRALLLDALGLKDTAK